MELVVVLDQKNMANVFLLTYPVDGRQGFPSSPSERTTSTLLSYQRSVISEKSSDTNITTPPLLLLLHPSHSRLHFSPQTYSVDATA